MIFESILVFGIVSLVDSLNCPNSCRCVQVDRRNLTVCQESGFKSVPPTIDRYTNALDLSANKLGRLENYTFSAMQLMNLESIVLRRANITELGKYTFSHLKWLKELDLSENAIASIDPFIFADNKILEMVNFSGNPLVTLDMFQFTMLPRLKSLDFRNCALQTVKPEAFSNLASLETLNLKGNQLATLPPGIFTWLVNLKSLDLNQNRWQCDCDIQMLTISLQYRGLYTNLTCIYGTNASVLWHKMDNVSEDCVPVMEQHTKEMLISGVPQLRPLIQFKYMNTSRRFSSHILEPHHRSWLMIGLGSVVSLVCLVCVIRICSRKCRRSKLSYSEYEEQELSCRAYRDYDEGPSTSFQENFCLLDDGSSDMSVSIDL